MSAKKGISTVVFDVILNWISAKFLLNEPMLNLYLFQCKCNGSNEVKVVQEFGCEKGGYPVCKNEPGSFNLVCKDGTKLTFPYILQWNIDTLSEQWKLGKDFKGCLCPDGIIPRFAG